MLDILSEDRDSAPVYTPSELFRNMQTGRAWRLGCLNWSTRPGMGRVHGRARDCMEENNDLFMGAIKGETRRGL